MDGNKTSGQGLLHRLPNDNFQQSVFLTAILALITTLVITRLITGSSSRRNGARVPPSAPYWIPYLGHVPRIVLNPSFALSRFRNRYSEGIFSIRLFSNVHTFLFKPSLVDALLNQPASAVDEQHVVRRLMVTNFGLRTRHLEAYEKTTEDLQNVNRTLLSESTVDGLFNTTVKHLREQMADLVTFNSYPADHMDWERLAHAELVEDNGKGERVMQADFMELMRNFVVKPSVSAIFGTNFANNFAEIWPHLWKLDEGFSTLALDIPRWLPWPKAQRARIALRQLLSNMDEFHEAYEKHLNGEEPGPQWQDLDNVSELVKKRTEIFRKHKLPIHARASYDLSLLWSLTAHSTSTICWALLQLFQDTVLLEQLRDEISPFVKIVEAKNEFGGAVWVPPEIEKLDRDALMSKCPLLKATYIETLRLYGGGWTMKFVKEDIRLEDGEKTDKGYVLEKGTFAHVAQDLHHTDPKVWSDPNDWLIHRHLSEIINEKGATVQTAKFGTIKSYGKCFCCKPL